MLSKKNKQYKKLKRRLRELEAGGKTGAAPQTTTTTAGTAAGTGTAWGIANLLPAGRPEQFLLGVALGAAGAYVAGETELRGKIIKAALKLYGSLASGVEEMKEQVEDIKAEMAAEQTGAA